MEVVIYARLSQEDPDPRPGEATATVRQIADARARAEAEGWDVLGIYEDPDHSASNLRRKRPAFERLLADLGNGVRVDAVLCYKLDRLLRHPAEAERIIELADARGFGIISLNDPGIDLTTPTGRAIFRMTITWAKLETETMSLRLRRKARAIAETGRPNGGGIRTFGLSPDRLTIVPAEAELIREAASRIIAGGSVHAIVTDWNARGVRTPGRRIAPEGRKWEASSLRRMLLAPRLVGDRSHHGVVTGSGHIPAILDRDTWERMCAILRAKRGGGGGVRVRRHFLTGLVVCGRCGARLVARPDARGVSRYTCALPRGCGRIVVAKSNLEPLIAEAIAQRLDGPAFRSALDAAGKGGDGGDALLGQLRADEVSLQEAATAYFVDRDISKAEYHTVRDALERRIEGGRQRIEARASGLGLLRLQDVDIRTEWATHTPAWQHDVAGLLIEAITVMPAPARGRRFDPSRIDVVWRV